MNLQNARRRACLGGVVRATAAKRAIATGVAVKVGIACTTATNDLARRVLGRDWVRATNVQVSRAIGAGKEHEPEKMAKVCQHVRLASISLNAHGDVGAIDERD